VGNLGIDLFGSSNGAGLLWAFAALALAARAGTRARRTRILGWALIGDETGASYMSGAVMIFPIKIMLIALVVELTLLFAASIGTFYGAYAMTRSAIVWLSANPSSLSNERIRLAAVQAMVPFSSSDPRHLRGGSGSGSNASPYIDAYRRYCPGGPLGDTYLANKYWYADLATTITSQPSAPQWDSDVKATVSFEHAIRTPLLGRAVGHRAPWGANVSTYTITASITLRNEGAKNDTQSLGIYYVSE
jgi:hypothetical protein